MEKRDMDLGAQATWRSQLESLSNSQRISLVSKINPIEIAEKSAPLLAAPLFLTAKKYTAFTAAAQALVDAAAIIEGHDSFKAGNILYDRLYASLSTGGKLFINQAPKPSASAI